MSKIKAGEAYVEITVEGAGRAEIALGKIQQTANAVNVSVKKLAASFAALNNLFAFGFRHISTFSAEFGKTGDVFDKASARLGISATALSEYDYAAQRCGASLGDVENAVKNIQKKLVEAQNGSDGARKAFEQLGLSVSDLAGLSPERQFEEVARAVGSIDDPTLRVGAALRLMRDAGQKLTPLFNEGPEGLRKLREEAKSLGASFSDSDAKLGAGYVDAITNLKASFQGLKNALAAELVPSIQKVVETLTGYFVKMREWTRVHQDAVEKIKNATKAFAPYVAQIVAATVAFNAIRATPVLSKIPAQWLAIAAAITVAYTAFKTWRGAVDAARGSQWSETAQKQLDGGDESRKGSQADLDRLKTLRDISKAHELDNSQLSEADRLAKRLRDAYGDVGIEVDKTTGKIKLATDAQRELNRRMLESEKRELEAALAEAKKNADRQTISLKIAGETELGFGEYWLGKKGANGKRGRGVVDGGWRGVFETSRDEKHLEVLRSDAEFQKKVGDALAEANQKASDLEARLAQCNKELENVPNEPLAELVETEEEYQKKLEDRKKALEAVADYEKRRADENRNGLEREIQQIEEETNAYREQLATLKKMTAEELKLQEARAKRIADALKDEEDETRRGELQTELDEANAKIEASKKEISSLDEKDAHAVQDQKERSSAAAQKVVDDWDRKYNGKVEDDAQVDQKEVDQYRDALRVKFNELSDEYVRLTFERATAFGADADAIDAKIQDIGAQLESINEKSVNADKEVADKKAEEKNEKDRTANERILAAAERFMGPAEKFQLAATQMDQALVDLAEAQESGDKDKIASALERLGEAKDKYESAESASSSIAQSMKSLGGSFDAWQAASLSTKNSTDKKLYDETRTQTRYLAEIARRVGVAAFG